ncbi:MAG: hypothetical protein PHE83_14650 [Opitutaceae bacterium]|nr:hypothetical protein [Opitutaceae bacterium]
MKALIRLVALAAWMTAPVAAQTALPPYVRQSGSEVTIGNASLERKLSLAPNLRTVSLANRLAGTEQRVDSVEFEFRLGTEYQTRLVLRPGDFEVKDLQKEETPQHAVLRLTLRSSSGVTVKVNYEARADEFFLRKWIELSLPKPEGIYVRQVLVDDVEFGPDVTIVPYEMLTHLARDSAQGSYFFALDNPYSIPSSSAEQRFPGLAQYRPACEPYSIPSSLTEQRWIALIYPPCLPIAADGNYATHTALLGAARRVGKFHHRPEWLDHQCDGASPHPTKIRTSLDLGEIGQLQRLVRLGSPTMGKRAMSVELGGPPWFFLHDSLPYAMGPGSGVAQLKESMDLTARFGIEGHLIGPEMASVIHVPEAWTTMDQVVVPYAAQKGLKIMFSMTSFGPSFWGGVGWVPGDPYRIFPNRRDAADNQLLAESVINFCRNRVDILFTDSNAEKIDVPFDQSRGFPGALPLSPSLYQDYQGWLKIFADIKTALPNLIIWPGHFGNVSAPLFNRVLSGLMFCESTYLLEHYKRYPDRPAALSAMKGLNDMEWFDYSYFCRERFLSYCDFEGNIWLQDDYDRPSDVSMEDASTLFRYLVLQRLAMTPSLTFYMPQPLMQWDLTDKDAEFLRHWTAFAKANVGILSQVQALDETPAFGRTSLFAHLEGGRGFLFVINPNLDTKERPITLGSEIGFPAEAGRRFAFREVYPVNRRLAVGGRITGAIGDRLTVTVPGTTVAVVEVSEEKTPALGVYGAEIQSEHPDDHGYAASVLGRAGERNAVVLAAPPGKTVEAVSVNGRPQSIASGLPAVSLDLEFPGAPKNREWMVWNVRNDGLQDGLASGLARGFSGTSLRFPLPEDNGATSLEPLAAFAGGFLWQRDKTPEAIQAVSLQARWREGVAPASESGRTEAAVKPEVPASTGSLWLSQDFQLSSPTGKCIFSVQLKTSELFTVRAWINGQEVRLQRFVMPTTNGNPNNAMVRDSSPTNPFAPYARVEALLRSGNNTVVMWIGAGQPAPQP